MGTDSFSAGLLAIGFGATVAMAQTAPAASSATPPAQPPHILVFTKTAGYRHDSISAGADAIAALGREHAFEVHTTDDAATFSDSGLEPFAVVVFLSTTGDVLNDEQQAAFERFIAAGRGYVGIHAAADAEYDWPWYGDLVGAYFKSHPAQQNATITVEDREHPSTAHLAETWARWDEWYDYRTNPRDGLPSELAAPASDPTRSDASQSPEPAASTRQPDGTDAPDAPPAGPRGAKVPTDPDAPDSPDPSRIRILASLITTSYQGSTMGDDHPIAWCHEFSGGRAWYTGGGHTIESFSDPDFLRHIAGGILWASGREDSR